MVARDLFLPVSAQPTMEWLVNWAGDAEALGYDRVWMPETWGRDAVTLLATIAERTDEIGVGSSIANVYSRSPALLGQTAATLQEASGGRFRMGVGPSGPILIEGWHGAGFERPLRRTRETIEIIRLVLAGEEVAYAGDVFDLTGFRLRQEPPEVPPPIDAAGLRSKSVELAGRFADGWHALMASPEGLRNRLDDFYHGAALGDRDTDDQRVTVGLTCCVLEDRERARRLVRGHLAFYVGAMGTFYREALAEQGYETEARTIAERMANGDREGAMAVLEDGLLDALALAGTAEECADRLHRFERIDGVDAISVSFPRAAGRAEIEATIEALAP